MLDTLRRGQRWLTALFVLVVGGVFVLFIGIGQPLQGRHASSIVMVGRYQYDRNDFERIRERREAQIQENVGEGYDARAMRDTLDQLTIQTLVDRGLLTLEAEALGLTVAKQEIERTVRSAGIFRGEGGRFDREAFERYAEYEYGNQRNFIEEQRQGLLATKLIRLLTTQARVSEAEAREVVRRQLETVQLAIVALDATTPPAGLEIGDEQVQALLAAREADARAIYEQRLETYDVPEQVRARHILLRVESGAPAEAVEERRKQAEAIHARLAAGEDFAELAGEISEDPGSKESGGDLGFFKRGQMVKPFEDAAFATAPGQLAPVFRSDFGFHVLRVEERKAAQLRSFDEVKGELAREILGREAAREVAQGIAGRLAEAIKAGKSLEAAARDAKLTLDRTARLQRRPDGFVPGLGAAQDLLALAFTLPAGASSPEIFEVGGKLALVQVLERGEPSAEEIAAAVPAQRTQLRDQKRRVLSDAWLADRRSQLAAEGELSVNLALLGRGES
jgi:peptidyl-prolyl cis-trans isomerase D